MFFSPLQMAGQTDLTAGGANNCRDDIRTQFSTREGVYKLVTLAEYSRPNRVAYNPMQGAGATTIGQGSNPAVRVNVVTLPSDPGGFCDRICFNHGRELYFYTYKGVKKAADLSKPIDKRIYKGTSPTCHDINKLTISSDSVMLLVGFTGGQIQLVDPIRKEIGKLYNEERIIEKTKVTCIKWLPGSPNLFLVSHASGQMYLYSEDVTCGGLTPPSYQLFKQGTGFSVWTCKAKSTRNPLYRWIIGDGAINDFAFSPCSKYLAVVSQDGCLRVLNYDTMELMGLATSYFGGLLCVCWSPDGQLVVAGGEDDLVTVWSFVQRRITARGQGHRSWITVVAFDPFTTSAAAPKDCADVNNGTSSSDLAPEELSNQTDMTTCYRLGSVAMDTQICLWELTDDVLKQPYGCRSRTSMVSGPGSPPSSLKFTSSHQLDPATPLASSSGGSLTQRLANLTLKTTDTGSDKGSLAHRRNFSSGGGGGAKGSSEKEKYNYSSQQQLVDPLRLIGTMSCPRLDEVPMLEPLVCKKVAQERLTALLFREDCVITACQDGIICTWARPTITGSHHSNNEGTMV